MVPSGRESANGGVSNVVYGRIIYWILKLGGVGVGTMIRYCSFQVFESVLVVLIKSCSVFAARYLIQYLDPDYERRQRATKAREELLLRLGV
jgi:hypothetical protein